MKKLKLVAYMMALAGLTALFSCEDDEPQFTLDKEEMEAPELSSPASGFSKVIMPEDTSDLFTVAWSEAWYGMDLALTYTVQLDVAGNEFASPASLGTTSVTSLSVTFGELNDILLNTLGQAADEAASVDLRVVSSANGQEEQLSSAVTISITPYEDEVEEPEPTPDYPKLWVAGDFQGWDIAKAATIVSKEDNGIYEGYLFLPEGGTNEFKLYAQPDWSPDSYGSLEDSVITKANYAGANLVAPSAGYYLVSVNMNDSSYFLMNTGWGIIGDATPNGWDSDTDLTFDEATQTWSVTTDMVVGSFKFRANDGWTLDFGVDEEGELIYANHPAKAYVDRPAIPIAEDGNYTITLDLSDPNEYTYSVEKN